MTPSLNIVQELSEHQRRCRACTRCVEDGILLEANPTFEGNAGARIFLVGQAPGPVEKESRRPFSGRAGRELVRWMTRAGWESEPQFRAEVYIGSMARCFPGRNRQNSGDLAPSRACVANCLPWLEAELALLRPLAILAVGGMAITHFLGAGQLGDRVGHAFGSDPVVIPLPHPSGQSRWLNSLDNRARLVRALELVSEQRVRCLRTPASRRFDRE